METTLSTPPPSRTPNADPGRGARVVSALTGGIHHRPEDRELARRIADRFPAYADRFSGAMEAGTAAALEAAAEGIRGLLISAAHYPDSGSWLVTHTGFLDAHPGSRAVCASPDAEILAVCRAAAPRTDLVEGVAADAERLLGSGQVRAMTHPDGGHGPGLPIAVIVRPVAHWWSPETAAGAVADYGRLLPSGSRFALFVPVPGDGPRAAEWLGLMEEMTGVPAYAHSARDAGGWLRDAGLDGVTVTDVAPHGCRPWPLDSRQPHVLRAAGRVP